MLLLLRRAFATPKRVGTMPLGASCIVLFFITSIVAANENGPCRFYSKQWQCLSNDGKCISFNFDLCNGYQDCADNSDEKFCNEYNSHMITAKGLQQKTYPGDVGFCSRNYFECLSEMRCVERSRLCDGKMDCADGSDENNWAHCGCDSGMKLDTDTLSCVDIDECNENRHECDQNCVNSHGSYQCTCNEGYVVFSDGHSCVPDNGTLVICQSQNVQLLSLNAYDDVNLDFGWQFEHQIEAVEYNRAHDKLYMAVGGSIFQSQRHGRAYCLIENLPPVSDIAVDWVTENLYLAFANYEIQVCRSDGFVCRKLISGSNDEEHKIIDQLIVNPKLGLMFWKGTFKSNHFEICFIEMASMDGEDRTVVADRVYDLSAMALDYQSDTLYFARYEHGLIIESIQMGQTDSLPSSFKRKTIFKNKQGRAPSDMLFYDQTLFLADGNGVISLTFITESQTEEEKLKDFLTPSDYSKLAMNHSLYQNPSLLNPCGSMACHHLCVLKRKPNWPTGLTCMCANGYSQDGRQCSPNKRHNITREPRMCVERMNILCTSEELCANGTCNTITTYEPNQPFCQCPTGKAGMYCEADLAEEIDVSEDDGMSVRSKILLCAFGAVLLVLILAAGIASWKIKMRRKDARARVVVLYKANTEQGEPILCL